jgi:hypothetical protein
VPCALSFVDVTALDLTQKAGKSSSPGFKQIMQTEKRKKRILSKAEAILASGVTLVFILLSLAHVLFLPPYEGFDETAHYSYISFLADQHKIPNFLRTPLDATMESGRKGLPRPYGSSPPFEVNGGITYSEFFRADATCQREEAVRRFWHEPQKDPTYMPGGDLNWQGQHPPLYYFLMGFPYRLARTWPPGMRLLMLRLCSVALACGSVLLWWKIISLLQTPDSRRLFLLAGLAAVFFPSLYYDLARLGNDSLVALLFAGSFYFLLATYVHRQGRLGDFCGLAFILGLGLLTKLFFFPLLVGTVLCSLWVGIRYTKIGLQKLLLRMSLIVGVPIVLSGGWFVLFYLRYGGPIGGAGVEMLPSAISSQGSMVSTGQFLLRLLRAAGGFLTTFFWCGTWSWVRPPFSLYICIVPLIALMIYALVSFFAHEPIYTEKRQVVISTIIFFLPSLLGFVYHMYLTVHFGSGGAGTPGHYLFFAWPVVGMVFAFPFEKTRTGSLQVATLIAFTLLSFFEAAGWWRSALVYSGFLQKVGTLQTGVGFLPPTVDNMAIVLERLRSLAFPRVAVALYVTAFLLRAALVTWVIFFLPPVFANARD